jgi:DhnA family fructose-bisphosphate aldolase class Ia
MRTVALVLIALLLGGCGSTQTVSLDSIRNQYLDAQLDYQDCMNTSGSEVINRCGSKRAVAEAAEKTYRDAMSKGLGGDK